MDALLADVTARLEAEPSEASLGIARALRRVRSRIAGELVVPELDPGRLADALLEYLTGLGVDRTARRVACLARTLGEAVEIGSDVLEAVPFTGFGAGSVGAAAAGATGDRFCWYASWLMATKGRPWYYNFYVLLPDDEVWVEGGTKVVLRRRQALGGQRHDVMLAEGTDDWRQAFIFKADAPLADLHALGMTGHYTFGRRDAETLEKWAVGAAIAVEVLERAPPPDLARGRRLLLQQPERALQLRARHHPHAHAESDPVVARHARHPHVRHAPRVARGHAHEREREELARDVGHARRPRPGRGRHLPPGPRRHPRLHPLAVHAQGTTSRLRTCAWRTSAAAENRIEVDGFSIPAVALVNKLHVMLVPRDDYCQPIKTGEHFAKSVIFWQLAMGIRSAPSAASSARAERGEARLRRRRLRADVLEDRPLGDLELDHVLDVALHRQGGQDGRRDVQPASQWRRDSTAIRTTRRRPTGCRTRPARRATSQANLGLWSHNLLSNNRVYAYDFSLDSGDVVVAARAGTVVDFDWVPNDSKPSTSLPTGVVAVPGMTTTSRRNIIVLRHDVDKRRLLPGPDPAHDLGPRRDAGDHLRRLPARARREYARALRDEARIPVATIQPADILNAATPVTVARGEPIMRSGDTGTSFHNHLHLHVQVERARAGPGPGRARNDDFTIPFVFREVSRFPDTDGVPAHFNIYFSENAR